MATSKIFQKAPIEVPNRSGFNMSHDTGFTSYVGTLVPFFWDFLLPKDEIDLGAAFQAQLPPLATDFIGKVDAKIEYFSVPVRTLFGGWKDFVVNPLDDSNNPSDIDGQLAKYLIGAEFESYISSPFPENYNTVDYSNYSNPTLVVRNAGNPTVNDLAEQLQKNFDDVMFFLSNYSGPSVVLSEDSTNVGPNSLADNLGFKVTQSSPSYDELFNTLISVAQSTFPERFQIIIDNLLSGDTYPSGNQSYDITSSGSSVVGDLSGSISMTNEFNFAEGKIYSYIVIHYLSSGGTSLKINNILPFLAYHKIYEDWYRDSKLQKSLFKRQVANTTAQSSVANMPWITSGAEEKIYFSGDQLVFANGHNLFDHHQRNFQKDYFTSATPEPQAGAPAKVSFDIQNSSGEFTIASLRAANALQQWLDRNNIAGFRYGDQVFAQYGIYPPDEITQRAIYLGSQTIPLYNKAVYQHDGNGGENTNNPFNIIGSKYANAQAVSQTDFVVSNYEVKDYCIVMGIYSLVPKARYATGTRRFFHYNDVSDIAFPMLAGVGDQEILKRELLDVYSGEGNTEVFGYTQRYAEYKFIDDQVHGLLRDGQSLDAFALQRSFTDNVELGSDFITIPKDYLDQVSAASYKISEFGNWVDSHVSYYKSSTLPAYSIPTLEDMKNTHTVIIDKNGKRL